MSEEEKKAAVKDFALTKGLLVALLAGVMSACFALGLDAGTPIKEAALAGGVAPFAEARSDENARHAFQCFRYVFVRQLLAVYEIYGYLAVIVCSGL